MWVDIFNFSEEDKEVLSHTKNLIHQGKIKLFMSPLFSLNNNDNDSDNGNDSESDSDRDSDSDNQVHTFGQLQSREKRVYEGCTTLQYFILFSEKDSFLFS